MGAVKSDAYGHGALVCAEVLAACGASWLAVASADEGCQLRANGIKLPILVLSPTPTWAVSTALDHDLDLSVTSLGQLNDLIAQTANQARSAGVHIKIDTGMHRLGFSQESIIEVVNRLKSNPQLRLVSVFSHLAKSDDRSCVTLQNEKFKGSLALFEQAGLRPQFVHLASSEATRRFPFTHYNMVRVGINLFGLEPREVAADLMPVLSLRGRINQIISIEPGESVGYGWTWTAERRTRLAVIPVGYGDGVDRRLSNRIRGLLSGQAMRQVGTISMDQMCFDITDIDSAQEGDVITLIGTELGSEHIKQGLDLDSSCLSLSEWAKILGTITYELACRLRVRLPRIYTRSNSVDVTTV